jgi:Lhr-like helicase
MLATVRTVIVDEIHAVAQTKRGAHLSLTLERLAANAAQPVQRIGLSATQKPIEEVAKFLVGNGDIPDLQQKGTRLNQPRPSKGSKVREARPVLLANQECPHFQFRYPITRA